MNKTSLRGVMAIILLAAASLACSFGLGGPKSPPTPTAEPTSVEPTQPIEQQIETQISSTSTPGVVQIKMTDAQLTQYLADQLKTQNDPVLQDPQVHAHDNVIDVYGKVSRGIISGNVKVTLAPTVDEQGNPHLKIQSADFGPVPVPESILNNLSDMVDQSMMANTDPQQTGYKVNSIQIFDGYIVINATPQ